MEIFMEIKNKKVIIIGERDGIQGPAIEECVKAAGGEPLFVQTQCFVWTAAGAFDLEGQKQVIKAVEEHGKENILVILGSPSSDSSELYAETLINGDPAWVGPLAGVALNLDVYHIVEPEIKSQIDEATYEKHIALMEMALDVDDIIKGIKRARSEQVNSE